MRQYTLIDGSAALDGVPDSIDPSEWLAGKRMSDPGVLELKFSLESGKFRSAIIGGFLPLFHVKFAEVLNSFPVDNIQYYPVKILDQNDGSVEENYLLANIIGLIDCVDLEKSKLKHWKSGMGFNFESMVIDESKTNGAKIFRIESDPTKIVITEDLKDFLVSKEILSGVEVVRTEDYSDW